ncbi:3-mercaptopyruvate sulfurtransferase [Lichenibacterium minor]|uniref:Sulfurtransferase n=1 Tax=Lichenibacterium minor TaxID=2316528 RepID=A0A4Q2UE53_9HYPH|nr:3-mercaptopyruvate sulfurtransferase [Lichenibacterium minor]RYC33095.1 3-mercaptopyruvate sulfurtransferase [Lichenibacterium minor]
MGAEQAKLVTAEWLAGEIDKPDLVVVDASWYLPTANRGGHAEFLAGHIPGAVFFDHDKVVDPDSALPHALPSPEVFAAAAGALGIAADKRIVVYDGAGIASAPRLWWMLRLFGAEDVAVLDGGYPAWIAGERPVETGESNRLGTHFEARPQRDAVADVEQVTRALDRGSAVQVVDARPSSRFKGLVAEPRQGLRSGHMPGAVNVPMTDLVAGGRFKDDAEIRDVFVEAGVDLDRPVITTCGSGVTAAVLAFGLARLGVEDVKLYDGSWSEWGARADLPVATDEA